MYKLYIVELNDLGKQVIGASSPRKLLLRKLCRFHCSSVDQNGPLLLMNVFPPEDSAIKVEVELQIPYQYVLYIAKAIDNKTLGFLMIE